MDGLRQGARFDRTKRAAWGFCLAAALLASAAASAQPADLTAPGYAQAIGEAVGHYSASRWHEAREAFARAHALQPSARTYRGLGLAAFYLGQHAAAREAFEQALADTRKPLPDDQRRELNELLITCARETGRVALHVVPASARVELDGVAIEQRVLFLERGEHVIEVSAEGHVPARSVLPIAGGEERVLELALVARAPVAQAPVAQTPLARRHAAPERSIAAPKPSEARSGRVFTWVAAAAVPVFAGAAAAAWFTGAAEHDAIARACALDGCDRAEADRRFEAAGLDTHASWTNVALAASGVALVAATILYFVEADADAELELGPTRAGAALHGHF